VKRQKEYGVLTDSTIRRIGGSFQTRSLYDRSLRGHSNIREPQRRARIRKEQMRSGDRIEGHSQHSGWLS